MKTKKNNRGATDILAFAMWYKQLFTHHQSEPDSQLGCWHRLCQLVHDTELLRYGEHAWEKEVSICGFIITHK